MFLAQSSIPIIGPIIDLLAQLMGYILDFIFKGLSSMGIVNMGLCIIIFTFVVKIAMLPMTIKQQRFSKMSAMVQPEISKIQKKYRGKKDQASMMKQNEEIQAVYAKYGISMTGGCLQLFIQLPIIYALFQVIKNIPDYIPEIHLVYENLATEIMKVSGYGNTLAEIGKANKISGTLAESANLDQVITYLAQFKTTTWTALADAFPNMADLITNSAASITKMNDFIFGINIADTPGLRISPYLIIPVAAALCQFITAKTMGGAQSQDNSDNPAANMTKQMMYTMPIMSFVMCFSLPAGVGIYWTASSLFQLIQNVCVNKYYDGVDMEKLFEKNKEKMANKKPSLMQRMTQKATSIGQDPSAANAQGNVEDKTISQVASLSTKTMQTENRQNSAAAPNSLAAKAGLVKQYDEKQKGGK